jgi:hypothetical protein
MENKQIADEKDILTNAEVNQSRNAVTAPSDRQDDEPKAKCECPPGCVGLPCCT